MRRALRLFIAATFCSIAALAAEDCFREQRIPSMGTVFEIQVPGLCHDQPQVWQQIQSLLQAMESEMSLYQLQSPLSQLNEKGHLDPMPSHLQRVIEFSLREAPKTGNRFNIAVLPVLELIQNTFKKTQKPPRPEQLQLLFPLIELNKIKIQGKSIQIEKGMKLTLDGVAKGDAVDRTAEILEAAGFRNYLVNFSGNMRWRGEKAPGKPWILQSWNPVKREGLKIPSSTSGSVASSGPEHASYSEDERWHHLIDPIELVPARRWLQTTVWGPSAAVCDLLSTATFVMDEKQIRETIEKHFPQYRVRIVSLDGKTRDLQRP